jgi:SAM-dependent methyltransferase
VTSSSELPTDPGAHDAATLDFYAAEASVYAARSPDGASQHLHAFLDRLAPGARILELGCGGGRDSAAMRARGFDIDPTDGSPEMAREASARLGRPVRVLRFDELDATGAYDAVWAHACLLHVPRKALLAVLARVFRALKPGGLHFADFKGGGAEGRDGLGRYYNYLTNAEADEAYRASGPWEMLSVADHVGGGYDGRPGPWVAVTARRPG